MLTRHALAALFLLPATALTACGSDQSATSADATCEYVADPMGAARKVDLPSGEPTSAGTVQAVITSTRGDIAIQLDAAAAPCTVNSFLSLASQDYFDDTECHRISTGPALWMLQCGDPTALGTGGPGYTVPDEITGDETYRAGTLAMANTGRPDSGGSQFFLVFDDSHRLPPAYTVFGHFDDASVELLQGIAAEGHDQANGDGTGRPTKGFTITDVVVG